MVLIRFSHNGIGLCLRKRFSHVNCTEVTKRSLFTDGCAMWKFSLEILWAVLAEIWAIRRFSMFVESPELAKNAGLGVPSSYSATVHGSYTSH